MTLGLVSVCGCEQHHQGGPQAALLAPQGPSRAGPLGSGASAPLEQKCTRPGWRFTISGVRWGWGAQVGPSVT